MGFSTSDFVTGEVIFNVTYVHIYIFSWQFFGAFQVVSSTIASVPLQIVR